MAEKKIELLFGSPGLGKTELVRQHALRSGLTVMDITFVGPEQKLRAIHNYRLAQEKVNEAIKRLENLRVDHEVIDMQDTLCEDLSDEEMYNIVTDMSMNTTLLDALKPKKLSYTDIMEGSDGNHQ